MAAIFSLRWGCLEKARRVEMADGYNTLPNPVELRISFDLIRGSNNQRGSGEALSRWENPTRVFTARNPHSSNN